jgi:hypothetical protein
MYALRQYGRVLVEGPGMTKKLLIKILVVTECVLGILMIVILTR